MPIKKDASGRRWVEMEVLLPGTPEQVWQAIATGPGYAAWFVPATIQERVGGKLEFHFGPGMESRGEVTTWEPPHRFGYVEREWSEGAPPVATEITLEARSGDRCVMRMVHSLFSASDAWDDQMEGFESGWPGFFDVLRLYLRDFAGQPAASQRAMAGVEGGLAEAWTRAIGRLGLAGGDVGQTRRIEGLALALAGTIECVHQTRAQRYLVLRLESPSSGVAVLGAYSMGDKAMVGLSLYFYGEAAKGAADAAAGVQTALTAALA